MLSAVDLHRFTADKCLPVECCVAWPTESEDYLLRQGQNLIRDSTPDFRINPDPDFRINPDPDVCRIAPKMLLIHYLVGTSHFAKYRKKSAGEKC